MDDAEKARRELIIASGDRTVDLQQAEHALDAVALPVEDAVMLDLTRQSDLCALSAGVEDPKAIRLHRISISDLDWRPSPLPNADAWRAVERDLPTGAFNCNVRPGFGSARPVHAVRTQHIGEDGDRVVALEGDEGGRFG